MTSLVRVALSILCCLAAACSELGNGTGQISQRIGEVIANPEAREVDLAKLTSFGWDRMYIFAPGSTREEICRFMGAGRNTCGRIIRYEATPSDHMTLLFGLADRLTHTELHAVANGRFVPTGGGGSYKKESSVFRIRRTFSGPGAAEVVLEAQ